MLRDCSRNPWRKCINASHDCKNIDARQAKPFEFNALEIPRQMARLLQNPGKT